MNSVEALSDLLNMADYCLEEEERKQIKKEYDLIKNDLELLDIIKFLIKKGDIVVNPDLFVDYPELYVWLEQDE